MTEAIGDNARQQIKAFIERIERINVDRDALLEDRREVQGEAKAMGFDVKALNRVIRERKKDRQTRMEEDAIFELYMGAVEG